MFTTRYITSQILIVIFFALQASSFFVRKHRNVLILNCVASLFEGFSYFCLFAWSGFLLTLMSIFRNVVLILRDKFKKTNQNTPFDYSILVFFLILTSISMVFTYEKVWSLLPMFALILSTISIWQKNLKAYNIINIFVSSFYLAYNICLKSIFGIACETILLLAVILGIIFKNVNKKLFKE